MNGRGHLKSPWHISLSIFPIYEECRVNDYILESSLSYREVDIQSFKRETKEMVAAATDQ